MKIEVIVGRLDANAVHSELRQGISAQIGFAWHVRKLIEWVVVLVVHQVAR
jgi:hypothetical protein